MKVILRATGILASGSAITVLIGLASAKASALLLGPAGVGRMGVLQSLVAIFSLVAGMGIGTSLVRLGAGALGRDDRGEAAALQAAATRWSWILGSVAAVVVLVVGGMLDQWLMAGLGRVGSLVIGIGILLTLVTNLKTSILNAHRRVGALARVSVIGNLVGAAASIAILWRWRAAGIPWAILAVLASGCAAASWVARREIRHAPNVPVRRGELRRAGRSLLRFGAPMMTSALVGSGVQLALPLVLLRTTDHASVGYFRAATALSVGYLGFLLTAMAQDYYPRVSAARDVAELRDLANVQIRLVNLVGVPVVLAAQVATPFIVPLLYSASFAPAIEVLRWQWVGDLFKLWSWTLSFIVLAHSGSRAFFAVELLAGVTLLGGTVVGLYSFGLAGMGIGYVATLLFYSAVVWMIVRRQIGFRLTRENLYTILASLAASVLILALSMTQASQATRVLLGGVVAGAFACTSSVRLWNEAFAPRGTTLGPRS